MKISVTREMHLHREITAAGIVDVYCINRGTPAEFYGLKSVVENQVLHAPNNWKTVNGAKRWAKKHGYVLKEEL